MVASAVVVVAAAVVASAVVAFHSFSCSNQKNLLGQNFHTQHMEPNYYLNMLWSILVSPISFTFLSWLNNGRTVQDFPQYKIS